MRGFLLLVLFLGNFISPAQTIISGGNVSGVWNQEGSPYLIQNDISIVSSLIIEPGVDVVFENYSLFQVFGTLTANGQINDSITFTVSDTSGFYNMTHNGWGGVEIIDSSSIEMKYCIIEYSTASGISIFESNTVFQDNQIRFCASGMFVVNASCSFERIDINNNFGNGIYLHSGYYGNPIIISDFIVRNNQGIGILCGDGSHLIADNGILSQNIHGIEIGYESGPQLINIEIKNNGSAVINGEA
ncbi:MAG: right-handed parallel beta-helix repeat-containing protein [Bacteroidales bacterium]